MFEVLVELCLTDTPSACRDVLLPGYESQTEAACEGQLAGLSHEFSQKYQRGAYFCAPLGPSATLVEVADGFYVHKGDVADVTSDNAGDVSNVAVVVGDRSIAVIDAGGSRKVAEDLYRAVRAISDLPIEFLVLTHMHPDHVLGAGLFQNIGAKVIGHEGLPRALADRAESYETSFERLMGAGQLIGSEVVLPDQGFDGEMTLDLGGRALELMSWPQSHTGTDVTVIDRQSGIMIAGDLLFHEHTPALDGSVLGWQRVLARLNDLDVSLVVPGHGGPILPWKDAMKPMERYLDVLVTDTRKAIADGANLGSAVEVIGQSEAEHWKLFELFNPRNATVSYTELEWE